MCGIVACRTAEPAAPFLVGALERLEYRGYDSAGIAIADPDGRATSLRTVDRVLDLAERLPELGTAGIGTVGLGHTRWATHGEVSVHNAHPHTDCHGRLAVAHNGIIENADELRVLLEHLGHTFTSGVDSEVIAHLVEEALSNGDLHTAVEQAVGQLRGSWAIVVMDAATGDLVAAAHHSPLVIARTPHSQFVASDVGAIAGWIDDFQVLQQGDVVRITESPRWRRRGVPVIPPAAHPCTTQQADLSLGAHRDFMGKEIEEQPEVARHVVDAWATDASGPALWQSFGLPEFRRVAILGCGTSLNAGRAVAGILGRKGGFAHQSIVASEAAHAVIEPDTLVIALSQSGETADVLRALDAIQPAGHPVLAITNNVHSALGRQADAVMACHAGREVGVAATKTFVAQVLTGACLAVSSMVAFGRLDPFDAQRLIADLKRVPELLEQSIRASHRTVPGLVSRFAGAPGYVFLGRGSGTVYADEGALKLKELSYRWAESYSAGELKHGPLALIERGTPVVVVDNEHDRLAANISEVEARGGEIIRIGGPGSTVPALGTGSAVTGLDWCGPLESVVAMQIYARELAIALGRDVDKPRNLAKSVTVE